jgi:hypothetical protein
MKQRIFKPGFRIDTKDVLVIVLGALGVGYVSRVDGFLALVLGFVLGHFFLFCNVLRLARRLELAWAASFTLLSGCTIALGQPGELITVLCVLTATLVVMALQLRDPSYCGVAWQSINPDLPRWWAAQSSSATGAGSHE